MKKPTLKLLAALFFLAMLSACGGNDSDTEEIEEMEEEVEQSAITQTFGGTIDMDNLPNYANQAIPNYINKDNTGSNRITDEGATLGRVLFYDKNM